MKNVNYLIKLNVFITLYEYQTHYLGSPGVYEFMNEHTEHAIPQLVSGVRLLKQLLDVQSSDEYERKLQNLFECFINPQAKFILYDLREFLSNTKFMRRLRVETISFTSTLHRPPAPS